MYKEKVNVDEDMIDGYIKPKPLYPPFSSFYSEIYTKAMLFAEFYWLSSRKVTEKIKPY